MRKAGQGALKQKLVILGAGGHAREMLDLCLACNQAGTGHYEILGFLDDNPANLGAELNGYPVLGTTAWLAENNSAALQVVCGIGLPASRKRVVEKLKPWGVHYATLVHPSAVLTPLVTMGEGTVITAGCVLTNRITLGNHVHLNLRSTVSHDCTIGDFSILAPGVSLAGNIQIGEGCEIGMGTVAIQGITIGEWSIIGAGAAVIRDLPANVTAVGVPARAIKSRPKSWEEGREQR